MINLFDEASEMSADFDVYSEADIGMTVVWIGAIAIVVVPCVIGCTSGE